MHHDSRHVRFLFVGDLLPSHANTLISISSWKSLAVRLNDNEARVVDILCNSFSYPNGSTLWPGCSGQTSSQACELPQLFPGLLCSEEGSIIRLEYENFRAL